MPVSLCKPPVPASPRHAPLPYGFTVELAVRGSRPLAVCQDGMTLELWARLAPYAGSL